MADLKGTQVAASIVPFTDLDTYATHDAEYGKGGFRSVDTNAKRDAIPAARKVKGMVVFVTDTGLHWWWTGTAWAEWIPKGKITVDAALSTTSQNPVQNKIITGRITNIESSASILEGVVNELSDTVAGIPRITVDTVWNPTSNNPASSKAIDSAISPIRTTANSANAKADSALGTANAAIPKSYIDDAMPENPVATRVPSTKLLGTVSAVANTAKSTADSAMTKASSASSVANAAMPKSWIVSEINSDNNFSNTLVPSCNATASHVLDLENSLTPKITDARNYALAAQTTANNAIPKSKIDTSIAGTETDNTTVPGTGAILTYINTANVGLTNQIIGTNAKVANLENWRNGIGNKNQANGVAGLDASGKISASQLPAGYDNVDKLIAFVANAPTSGMTIGQKWYITSTKKIFTATSATSGSSSTPIGNDMIYIDQNANKSYYWSGTDMVNIGSGNALALGTTHSTAFYGDFGNILYTNFGTGTNLQGTKDARDFFHNMALYKPLGNIPIISSLHVNAYSNYVKLQDEIIYLIGEPNTGDGYDIPAVTTSTAGVMTADMFNTFQKLTDAVFPLLLSTPTSSFTYEVGSSNNSSIPLTVTKGGVDVSSQITDYTLYGRAGTISSDHKTYNPVSATTSTSYVDIIYKLGSLTSNTLRINWYFKYKKYWGTSASASLTNAQILALGGSTWADSRTMGSTNFDCTGGKYPYYVIPADIYTGLEVWVGGLKNTDITVTDMTVTNASGSSKAYKVIRLTNIQTGVLSIQFK